MTILRIVCLFYIFATLLTRISGVISSEYTPDAQTRHQAFIPDAKARVITPHHQKPR